MKITEIKLSLPVFEVKASITYQTIRQPTVFEKMLLQLIGVHQHGMGQFTLKDIVCKTKVDPIFIEQALDYLHRFGALILTMGQRDLSTRLSDFALTQEGKVFLQKNQLPSENKKANEAFFLEALSDRLTKKRLATKSSKNGVFLLPAELFLPQIQHLNTLADEQIDRGGSKEFTWKTANTRVDRGSIRSEIGKISRFEESVELCLDANKSLSISAANPLLQNWLDHTDQEVIWQAFLSEVFAGVDSTLIPVTDWRDVMEIALVRTSLENKTTLLRVVRTLPEAIDQPTILLSESSNTNTSVDKVLVVPDLDCLGQSFIALELDHLFNATVVHRGQINIFFAGQPRTVTLTLRVKDREFWPLIRSAIHQHHDSYAVAFVALFEGQKEALKRLPAMSMQNTHEFWLQLKGILPKADVSFLLGKVLPLQNLEEIKLFRTMFPQVLLEEAQLTRGAITALLTEATSTKQTYDPHVFSGEFARLLQTRDEILARIGIPALELAEQQQIKAGNINTKSFAAVSSWKHMWSDLSTIKPLYEAFPASVKTMNNQILNWEMIVQHNLAPKRSDGKQVVVLDTNSLMSRPEILSRIKPNHFVVVPRIVLQELDGLKNSESPDTAKKARDANNALKKIQYQHYEEEKLSLMPLSADKPVNDDRILSVALFHRLNQAFLITNDTNLQNHARSENIRTQSANEYLGYSHKGGRK